jgi:hypothetical protein
MPAARRRRIRHRLDPPGKPQLTATCAGWLTVGLPAARKPSRGAG